VVKRSHRLDAKTSLLPAKGLACDVPQPKQESNAGLGLPFFCNESSRFSRDDYDFVRHPPQDHRMCFSFFPRCACQG
jgi:hypothetical protein